MKSKNSNLSSGVVFLQKVNDTKVSQSRNLRKEMTLAEKLLWQQLRGRKLNGVKFRRQQVIEGFIVDFFSHELKLVVEIDGEIHNNDEQKEIDKHRKEVFKARGLREIRFTNIDVLDHLDMVLVQLKQIQQLTKYKD